MIAVKSEPLAKLIARVQPTIAVPAGVSDRGRSDGLGLDMAGAVASGEREISAQRRLSRMSSKVFQAWLISTQHQSSSVQRDRSSTVCSSGWR